VDQVEGLEGELGGPGAEVGTDLEQEDAFGCGLQAGSGERGAGEVAGEAVFRAGQEEVGYR
jgi:hypothetical protein